MMMSWFYILVFYVMSILVFFNYNNPIMFWMLMELNLLSFSLIFLLDKGFISKQDSLNYLVFYFLIQSSASMLFLSNFCFKDWGSIFNVDIMFLGSLVLKIGLFPLFFWVFKMGSVLSFFSLFLLLTIQKIPLLLGVFCCSSSILFYILGFSFFIGSIILFFSKSFVMMIISSSISYSFMMFLFYSYSPELFLFFFFIYSGFIYFVLNFYFGGGGVPRKSLFLFFSFFMGLPPLSLFFFKFLFSEELSALMGPLEMLFFWIFSLVSLAGYLKFFFFSFYEECALYLKNEFCFEISSLIYYVFFFFLVFCC